MGKVRRVETFYGDLKKPKGLESVTKGDGLSGSIEAIYGLQGKYLKLGNQG